MKIERQREEDQLEQRAETLLDKIDLGVAPRPDGIVIGTLIAFDGSGYPQVTWPGSGGEVGALTTVALGSDAVGREVALSFVHGPSRQPLILGLIQAAVAQPEVRADNHRLVLEGRREVELRCGKASILLREDGRVIVKGTHLISRSSGANKIKGASVSIN